MRRRNKKQDREANLYNIYDNLCQFGYFPGQNDSYRVCLPLLEMTSTSEGKKEQQKFALAKRTCVRSRSYPQGHGELDRKEENTPIIPYWKVKRRLHAVFKQHRSFDSLLPDEFRIVHLKADGINQHTETSIIPAKYLESSLCFPNSMVSKNKLDDTTQWESDSYDPAPSPFQQLQQVFSSDWAFASAPRRVLKTNIPFAKRTSCEVLFGGGVLNSSNKEIVSPFNKSVNIQDHVTKALEPNTRTVSNQSSFATQVKVKVPQKGVPEKVRIKTKCVEGRLEKENSPQTASATCKKNFKQAVTLFALPNALVKNEDSVEKRREYTSASVLELQKADDSKTLVESNNASLRGVKVCHLSSHIGKMQLKHGSARIRNQRKIFSESGKSFSLESTTASKIVKSKTPTLRRSHSTDNKQHHVLPQFQASLLLDGNYLMASDEELTPRDERNFGLCIYDPVDISLCSQLPGTSGMKKSFGSDTPSQHTRPVPKGLQRQNSISYPDLKADLNDLGKNCLWMNSNDGQSKEIAHGVVVESSAPLSNTASIQGNRRETLPLKRLHSGSDLNERAKKRLEAMKEKERIRCQSLVITNTPNCRAFNVCTEVSENINNFSPSDNIGYVSESQSHDEHETVQAAAITLQVKKPFKSQSDIPEISAQVRALHRSLSVNKALSTYGDEASTQLTYNSSLLARGQSEKGVRQLWQGQLLSEGVIHTARHFRPSKEKCFITAHSINKALDWGKTSSGVRENADKNKSDNSIITNCMNTHSVITCQGTGVSTQKMNLVTLSLTIVKIKSWKRKCRERIHAQSEDTLCCDLSETDDKEQYSVHAVDSSKGLEYSQDQAGSSASENENSLLLSSCHVGMSRKKINAVSYKNSDKEMIKMICSKPYDRTKSSVYTVWRTYSIIRRWSARAQKSHVTRTETVCETHSVTHASLPGPRIDGRTDDNFTDVHTRDIFSNNICRDDPRGRQNLDSTVSQHCSGDIIDSKIIIPAMEIFQKSTNGREFGNIVNAPENAERMDQVVESSSIITTVLTHTNNDDADMIGQVTGTSEVVKTVSSQLIDVDKDDGVDFVDNNLCVSPSHTSPETAKPWSEPDLQSQLLNDTFDVRSKSCRSSQGSTLSKKMIDVSPVEDEVFFSSTVSLPLPASPVVKNPSAWHSLQQAQHSYQHTAHDDKQQDAKEKFSSGNCHLWEVQTAEFSKFEGGNSGQSYALEFGGSLPCATDINTASDIVDNVDEKTETSVNVLVSGVESGACHEEQLWNEKRCSVLTQADEQTQVKWNTFSTVTDSRQVDHSNSNFEEHSLHPNEEDVHSQSLAYALYKKDGQDDKHMSLSNEQFPDCSIFLTDTEKMCPLTLSPLGHSLTSATANDLDIHPNVTVRSSSVSSCDVELLDAGRGHLSSTDFLDEMSDTLGRSSKDEDAQDIDTLSASGTLKRQRSPSLLAMFSTDSLFSRVSDGSSERKSAKRETSLKGSGPRKSRSYGRFLEEDEDDGMKELRTKTRHSKLKLSQSSLLEERGRGLDLEDISENTFGPCRGMDHFQKPKGCEDLVSLENKTLLSARVRSARDSLKVSPPPCGGSWQRGPTADVQNTAEPSDLIPKNTKKQKSAGYVPMQHDWSPRALLTSQVVVEQREVEQDLGWPVSSSGLKLTSRTFLRERQTHHRRGGARQRHNSDGMPLQRQLRDLFRTFTCCGLCREAD
ncbi:uncharacterized protein LOC106012110 [Aplysia californica]|uniref:Uncharacterized protein LOC106012110 n=1 Tax=Aplysia californica TaxID=6500 RepID=A0ABM1A298_APLCA|nr:uncharacterized protein LOC106012110 [Aplysia californica]